jgi:hypothetical protein
LPSVTAHDVLTVKYEELVAHPVEQTARVFAFIGSARRSGVSSYRRPVDFEWAWGSDDGGQRLLSLNVGGEAVDLSSVEPELVEALRADSKAVELMRQFGYPLPWEACGSSTEAQRQGAGRVTGSRQRGGWGGARS